MQRNLAAYRQFADLPEAYVRQIAGETRRRRRAGLKKTTQPAHFEACLPAEAGNLM